MTFGQRLSAATAALVIGCALTATPAAAATITLTTPLTGNSNGVSFVDLTVSFDGNGNPATNITGWELYVSFAGLSPIDSSFALGSIFTPYAADVVELHGTCASGAGCTNPPADPASAQQYMSLASVFWPYLPQGPGTLFSLRFAVDPGSPQWSLSLFGEAAAPGDPCGVLSALTWEHPTESTCQIGPFAIVPAGATTATGTAVVGVSAVPVPATVPEPSTVMLISAGLAALAARSRRRA